MSDFQNIAIYIFVKLKVPKILKFGDVGGLKYWIREILVLFRVLRIFHIPDCMLLDISFGISNVNSLKAIIICATLSYPFTGSGT